MILSLFCNLMFGSSNIKNNYIKFVKKSKYHNTFLKLNDMNKKFCII